MPVQPSMIQASGVLGMEGGEVNGRHLDTTKKGSSI